MEHPLSPATGADGATQPVVTVISFSPVAEPGHIVAYRAEQYDDEIYDVYAVIGYALVEIDLDGEVFQEIRPVSSYLDIDWYEGIPAPRIYFNRSYFREAMASPLELTRAQLVGGDSQ